MATPQYTIKTGADSSDYFAREVTISDKSKGFEVGDNSNSKLGLVKDSDSNISDDYQYPVLVRRTGDSLKGTTESIESQELRKGRTKSAPRKGNSSSEGSLDFELSPETYDDILEAALRGEWKEWFSDSKVRGLDQVGKTGDDAFIPSGSNLDKLKYQDGMFESRIVPNGNMLAEYTPGIHETKLLSKTTDTDVFSVIKVSDPAKFEVHELTCGTQDIRYSVVKHFGGVKDDDLFQTFEHLSVDTMSLSVTPGQIITGSFGFMGSNNPEIVQWGDRYSLSTEFVDGTEYFTYDPDTKSYSPAPGITAETWEKDKYYVDYPCGEVKQLKDRLLKDKTTTRTSAEVMTWLENLPQKGTSTDQYTAREGFLYINGERVRYGSNLTFELSNGLNKTFAIFEKDAIAMSPLELNITGSLGAYLIKGYSEKLYQLAVQDKDIELVFCFQDKEENPEALYLFQIFKAKFTDTDVSSGAENLEVTFPYQSFEEKAVRVLRTRLRKIRDFAFTNGTESDDSVAEITFSTVPPVVPVKNDFKIVCKYDDTTVESFDFDDTKFATDGKVELKFAAVPQSEEKDTVVSIAITYNGNTISKQYTVEKKV